MSENPFSDNAEPEALGSRYSEYCDSRLSLLASQISMASKPEKIAVPILTALPRAPQSFCSSLFIVHSDSTTLTPTATYSNKFRIRWDTAELMHLLSILHSTAILNQDIFFSPPLEDLTVPSSLTHLRILQQTPTPSTLPTAFPDQVSPSTSKSYTRIILADSGPCANVADAKQALAHALLSNKALVHHTIDEFNVFCALYSQSTDTLKRVRNSMDLMLRVSDGEWQERLNQLRGWIGGGYYVPGVDAESGFEARFEMFLLSIGRTGSESWIRRVGLVKAREEGERPLHKQFLEALVEFLGRAYRQEGE